MDILFVVLSVCDRRIDGNIVSEPYPVSVVSCIYFFYNICAVCFAGAIMVLFLFVIMYLNLNTEFNIYRNWIAGLAALISGGCLFLIVVSALGQNLSPTNKKNEYEIGLIEKLGMTLYRDYLLPMELSSVLFLVAMIGVVLLGRKEISETSQVRIP